ncbi:hypothetical protein [Aquisphaera insulae]|uniref:hypothetical protein n=1 Tax=Aquisphaera insulae TaxID=2712864 RepID=UPI0013EC064B|nr:hypothetical protein [Aquisphaera insulae]
MHSDARDKGRRTMAVLAGPRQYRRFVRLSDRFFRLVPWLWGIGCVGCLLASLLRLGDRGMAIVCVLTIYPALVGYFGLNGLIILWRRLLVRGRKGGGGPRSPSGSGSRRRCSS